MSRLHAIAADVRAALEARQRARPLESFAGRVPPGRTGRLAAALRRSGPGEPVRIIAEVKKASPSRGVLSADVLPLEQARRYQRGGAAALSVLTEEKHFCGSPEFLRQIAGAVPLPALQKDFTLGEYQLHEALELGASAVLLIAALLPEGPLASLRMKAEALGLDALVEVHDEAELDAALASGARLLGINNRDLRTFEVTLDTTLRLLPKVPGEVVRISESGVSEREHVLRLEGAGVDALLVGEALMRSPDPERALRRLRGVAA